MSYQILGGKVVSSGSDVIPGLGWTREYRWNAVDDKIIRLYVVVPHFSDPLGENGKKGYLMLLPHGAQFDSVANIILRNNNLVG